MADPITIYSIGFTKKTAEQFFSLLKVSGAKSVIDIRLNNQSQLAGFSKRGDLKFFLKEICGIQLHHMPNLAPTQEMLKSYQKKAIGWEEYEKRFLELMTKRKIEESLPKELVNHSCLLCSEDKPHRCHRRLVGEYLQQHWGQTVLAHL